MAVTCQNNLVFTKMMVKFTKQNKMMVIIYILFLLLIPVKNLCLPHMIGRLYENFKQRKNFHTTLFIIIFLVIIIQISYVLSDYIELHLQPKLDYYFKKELMTFIMDSRTSNYEEVQTGQLISMLTKLPNIVFNYIDSIKGVFIPAFLTLTVIAIYFGFFNLILGIAFILVTLCLLYSIFYSLKKCSIYALDRDKQHNSIAGNIDDIMRNMLNIISCDDTDNQFIKLNNMNDLYTKYTKDTLVCSIKPKVLFIPTMLIIVIMALYFMWNKFKAKKIKMGVFITIVIMLFLYMNTVYMVLDNIKGVILRWGVIENALTMFTDCKLDSIPYNLPIKDDNKNGISFQDVYFNYYDSSTESEKIVFENFNFTFPSFSTTLIVGRIGSGKSTLINLIMRYQVPQKGEVFYNGEPISHIDITEWRRNLMYLPQNPILLNTTLYDNLSAGFVQMSREHITQVIHDHGLDEFISVMPNGLDTQVGNYGSKLSGGQRQVAWLIKIILHDPKVILLDEPTASVDIDTKEVIKSILHQLKKNRTLIIISHDSDLYDIVDKIVEMNDGKIKDIK